MDITYCLKENFKVKLVFNSFKIKNYFSYKDPIPDDLKSFLAYKFTCASCSFSYTLFVLKLSFTFFRSVLNLHNLNSRTQKWGYSLFQVRAPNNYLLTC